MNKRQFRMIMMVLFAIADELIFNKMDGSGRSTILLAIEDFTAWTKEQDGDET